MTAFARLIRWLLLSALLLAGCEPEATPLPAYVPPTETPAPTAAAPDQLHYALTSDTIGYVAELDLLNTAARVEQLTTPIQPADLGTRYDLVARYGEAPGWTRSPVTPHVALVLNPAAVPLDNPALLNIMRRSIDASALIGALAIPGAQPDTVDALAPRDARVAFANTGYPDGFSALLGYAYTPGALIVSPYLRALGIENTATPMTDDEIAAALTDGSLTLALVSWTTPESRARWTAQVGDANVIDLYTTPISYWAADGLTVTFTPGGFPVPE